MRNMSTLLCTGTALALALAATPASAQTPPAQDPAVEAPAVPPEETAEETAVDPAAVDPAAEGDAIVVTGLRRSLQSAQNIKRNSEQIVDAIVAEDIGKLPDVTASAALARVTGVQVTRSAGEAADVQIRGLPDIGTTYNGREIFTDIGRNVAIQDFPAGSVAALEVFKSSTANLIEGGLGGQVNVRSRRPFDFTDFELSGSFNVVRFTQKDDTDWNGNLLFSNRWDVGDGGEFGLLLNAAMTNIDFLDSTRENSREIRDIGGGNRAPNFAGIFLGQGDRYRPSANFAMEYRPNNDLRFYIDGLFQGYRARDDNMWLFVPLSNGAVLTDLEIENGRVVAGTASGGFNPDGYYENFDDKTNTYQLGGGFSADLGSVRWTGDIAWTDSTFTRNQANVDYAFASNPSRRVQFDVDEGPGGATIDFLDFDTSDPDNYVYRGLFLRREKRHGDDIQFRTDVEYETGWTNLPRIQVGVRHNNRDADFQEGGDYRGSPFRSFDAVPVDIGRRPCGFDYDNLQSDRCFVGTRIESVFDNLAELAAFAGFPSSRIPYNPLSAFTAGEKASAIYGQLRYEFDAGFPIDGLVGLRAVRTKSTVEGTLRTFPGDIREPISATNTYTDYLPNISARFGFQSNLQARLAYTETRSRANFGDLNPGSTLDPPVSACDTSGPGNINCFRFGSGGNANLKPIESRNLDATLEYYFARQGQISLAVFNRNVRNFIFRDTTDIADGTVVNFIRFNSPQNTGKGKIRGFELAGTAFFDYDFLPRWAHGFGVQANYTYIDATTELSPQYRNGQLPGQQRFPGVSKHSYNLIGLYEQGPVSARLAYNYRSKFVREYNDIDGFQSPLIQKGLGQLDFSASYTPIKNVTVAFDALNLLAGSQPIRTYREYNAAGDSYPWGVKYLERVFSLGVRFRY